MILRLISLIDILGVRILRNFEKPLLEILATESLGIFITVSNQLISLLYYFFYSKESTFITNQLCIYGAESKVARFCPLRPQT
jgi:hypothetical protein